MKVRQGKSMTRAHDVEFEAAGVSKHYDKDRQIASVSIAGNVIDHAEEADPDEKPKRVRIEIGHDDPMLPVYVDALVAMRDQVTDGGNASTSTAATQASPQPLMHPCKRLHTRLSRDSWKLSSRMTQAEAAIRTSGNTDKFLNGDYWVLGEDGFKPEGSIPIGTAAVYYRDSLWWLVEKVK